VARARALTPQLPRRGREQRRQRDRAPRPGEAANPLHEEAAEERLFKGRPAHSSIVVIRL
jgi:hypothetical protein